MNEYDLMDAPDILALLAQIVERLDEADEQATLRVTESIARIATQDAESQARIEEQNKATGSLIAHMQTQMDVMYGALTGDMLHPNGLLIKVKQVDEQVTKLEKEWHELRSTIKGVGLALGALAGVAGGAVAALINGVFGG